MFWVVVDVVLALLVCTLLLVILVVSERKDLDK